jgi:hypothetical protein
MPAADINAVVGSVLVGIEEASEISLFDANNVPFSTPCETYLIDFYKF